MKKVTADIVPVGTLAPHEVRNFAEWVQLIPNDFDKSIAGYPRLVMSRALADGEPYMYCPLHPALMVESLAPKPGTPVIQIARGLQAISNAIDDVGKLSGHGEAFFITSSEPEMMLATKRGWACILHDSSRKQWLLKRRLPRPDFSTL